MVYYHHMIQERGLSRRDFLKSVPFLAAGVLLPKLENSTPLAQDLTPERVATYSVLPFGDRLDDIAGIGYTHLQATRGINNQLDGGHHIGSDFNWGLFDEDLGTPLKMIMDGVCVFAQEQSDRDLGTIAIFCHQLSDGTLIYSRYAHLDSVSAEVGTNYRAGDLIGKMGKSGWENGWSHLHLDIAKRICFEERYSTLDPFWYPRKAPLFYLNYYFLDPVSVIKSFLDPENKRWEKNLPEK